MNKKLLLAILLATTLAQGNTTIWANYGNPKAINTSHGIIRDYLLIIVPNLTWSFKLNNLYFMPDYSSNCKVIKSPLGTCAGSKKPSAQACWRWWFADAQNRTIFDFGNSYLLVESHATYVIALPKPKLCDFDLIGRVGIFDCSSGNFTRITPMVR